MDDKIFEEIGCRERALEICGWYCSNRCDAYLLRTHYRTHLAFQYSHVLSNGAPFPPWNKLALTDAKPQIIPVASLQPLAEDECIIAGLDAYGEAIALSARSSLPCYTEHVVI